MTSKNSAEEAEAVNPKEEKAEEEPIEISNVHSNSENCDNTNVNNENNNVTNSETIKPPPQPSTPSNDECKLPKEPVVETYTDHTGTDLMQFLTDTLQNNPKDRIHLLKIEKQLTDLVKDPKRNQQKFGPMSSYHRMLVHRVAAFFGMDHNVTNIDNSVIVSKTRTTRLPEFKFSEQIKNTSKPESNEPVRSIIKRDSSSLDKLSEKGYLNDKSPDRRGNTLPLVDSRRSKSLEEREEEYEKARARIFNQNSSSSTENPNDACANTSTTDDSVATTSSGIAMSSSATNSSPSCSHEDLKPGSNWPSTDSRLWSSTESEGSNRPRFLRLQRQKRLPDSFDSDSARTSFTTSSSMSSSSGMFLTPDSCLTEQQPVTGPPANRLTFTKASSFGGISHVVSRDNIHAQKSALPISSTASIPLCYIHPPLPVPPPQPSMSHHHHHNRITVPGNPNTGQIRIDPPQGYPTDRYMTNLGAAAANPHNQQIGRPPDTYSSNVASDIDMLGQSSQRKSNLIILGSQLPVNTSNYGSYQPISLQQSPLQAVPQVQSLVPSFQNQPQTNRIPNVPFNPNAVSGVPASIPSSGPVTVGQASVVTGTGPQAQLSPPPPIGCNNRMMNHNQSFPYTINHVSLPTHNNGGQLATATNFTYAPSMQVPPTIPMYFSTNGGAFAPNQLTGARPMPPPPPPHHHHHHHQAQMVPSPYSQTPVYRPVPLIFVFNFQNKRSN